ncbi:TAXI family TRAP transporter solute-binding subunit [Mesorhizobium xinjiangense]|uniref:TAXI family TRAP transporter solute-binding subunit n=1 Tax=Mesorhizobium xinjiangense TaxID=2678685 RepID=UPI0018DE2B28|nr:TAXI family TRAP transporter solute-binding subunit [Mesorhizobium xinjiangense]
MRFSAVCLVATLLAGTATAGDLPAQMKWTAYPSDTSGYAQAIAIGNMLKDKEGTRVAVLPGQNDIARLTPIKNSHAEYCMCGVAAYFGAEGVTNFAAPNWGPIPLRMIMAKIDGSGVGFATRGDAGIETAADLRGKRVPFVKAADALNLPLNSVLAFGGLTRDDVETIEYSGFSAMWDGVINDQSEVAFATTLTPKSAQLASGPSGIHWIPLPFDDEEGWKRLQEKAPYISKRVVTDASGLEKGKSFEGAGYPYPFLVTTDAQSEAEVYALTKAMVENFDDYKDAAPGAEGWALKVQELQWVIPFHEGTIRYFREAGIWTDEADKHNRDLVKRQDVLKEAWNSFDMASAGEGEEFATKWLTHRAEALKAADMPVIFD